MIEIFELLRFNRDNNREVRLATVVFNAYSKQLTTQYLGLLSDLARHGMKKDNFLTLMANPMVHWSTGEPRIADLVAYFNDDHLVDQYIDTLLSGESTNKESNQCIRVLLREKIVSPGFFGISRTNETMLDRIHTIIMKPELPNPATFYKLWSQGYCTVDEADNHELVFHFIDQDIGFTLRTEFQTAVVNHILTLPRGERDTALTLAKTSQAFPVEATRIERELERLQTSDAAQPVITRPMKKRSAEAILPAVSEAPKPSPATAHQLYPHLKGVPAPSEVPMPVASTPMTFFQAAPLEPYYDPSLAFIHAPLPSETIQPIQAFVWDQSQTTGMLLSSLDIAALQPEPSAPLLTVRQPEERVELNSNLFEAMFAAAPSTAELNSNMLDAMLAAAVPVPEKEEKEEKRAEGPQNS